MSEHLREMQRQIDALARDIERLKTVEKFPTIPDAAWTPALSFGGGSTGMTYAAQNGRYVKVGNAVILIGYIVLSAKGSSTGNAAVTLPLVASGLYIAPFATSWNLASTYVNVQVQPSFNLASAIVQGATAAATGFTQLTDTAFNNSSILRFSGVYFV